MSELEFRHLNEQNSRLNLTIRQLQQENEQLKESMEKYMLRMGAYFEENAELMDFMDQKGLFGDFYMWKRKKGDKDD